jgi:protein-tyrosine-phosphatase
VVDLSGPAPVILRKGALPRAQLERALGVPVKLSAVDVMFVCTGNTCRSPMAEGYLRHLLPKQWLNRVSVHSSGTGALPGMPATGTAVLAVKKDGFTIGGHRSTLLTDRLIQQADLVVVMEEQHRQAIRVLVPEAAPVLLAPDGVPDPIGGELAEYGATMDLIKREMPDVLALIRELLPGEGLC